MILAGELDFDQPPRRDIHPRRGSTLPWPADQDLGAPGCHPDDPRDRHRADEPAIDQHLGAGRSASHGDPTGGRLEALSELGKPGGLMDAKDNMAAGPIALIVDPLLNLNNPNNDTHTAGVTFMGQFLDHDMTFDTTSRLGQPANPRSSPNARNPFFDLDSVYGDGPSGSHATHAFGS